MLVMLGNGRGVYSMDMEESHSQMVQSKKDTLKITYIEGPYLIISHLMDKPVKN